MPSSLRITRNPFPSKTNNATLNVRMHPLNKRRKPGPNHIDKGDETLGFSDDILKLIEEGELEPNRDFTERKSGRNHETSLKLAAEIQTTGSIEARNALVQAHKGLVGMVFNRCFNGRMRRTDLMQAGMLGLLRATEDFNPSFGVKFSTYAIRWIFAKMQRCDQKDRKVETCGQRADGSGFEQVMSLDRAINENGDTVDVPDESLVPADEEAQESAMTAKVREVFARALASSNNDPKVAAIIEHRLLAHKPKTFDELGQMFGLSRERMRQIESRLLTRNRHSLEIIHKEYLE